MRETINLNPSGARITTKQLFRPGKHKINNLLSYVLTSLKERNSYFAEKMEKRNLEIVKL